MLPVHRPLSLYLHVARFRPTEMLIARNYYIFFSSIGEHSKKNTNDILTSKINRAFNRVAKFRIRSKEPFAKLVFIGWLSFWIDKSWRSYESLQISMKTLKSELTGSYDAPATDLPKQCPIAVVKLLKRFVTRVSTGRDNGCVTEHPDSWQAVGHPRLEWRFSLSSWPRECLLRCAADKGVTAWRSRLTMTRNFDRESDIHNLPLNSRTRANSTFHLASSSRHLDAKTQSMWFDRYT